MSHRKCFAFLILLFLFLFSSTLYAQENTGRLTGTVVDMKTEEPLSVVYLHLEEARQTAVTDSEGHFEFNNIPLGSYTLTASRLGYRTVSRQISISADETTTVTLKLNETALSLEKLVVTADNERILGSGIEGASVTISGSQLRQNLGNTLAQTLEDVPGLSSRSLGAAARPVLRGLGGRRVIILQDGFRTGDVSAQSADHAVTIDPIGAEKIEIARGPAALQYGSNAVGGVINVVSNQIPSTLPDRVHGAASIQGASVSNGTAGALELGLPIGSLAAQLSGNLRRAANIQTPVGEIENTSILSTQNAVGVSYLRPWGYAGVSSSIYINHYGIPPDPEGGHPNGVNIEMRSYDFAGKAEIILNDELFQSLRTDLSYSNYFHKEIEQSGIIGTEYGLLSTNAAVSLDHKELGFINEGTWGAWGEITNFAVNGALTPDTDSYSFSAYAIEKVNLSSFNLEAGLRFDYVNRIPETEDSDSRIGAIRQRNFSALSSSASAVYEAGHGFFIGAVLLHSFRAPSAAELYSQGPHLAAYFYEVGNPDLDPERGLAKELFFEYRSLQATAKISLYHNSFSNYIFPRNTGEPSIRFPGLNVYQYVGVEAAFYGAEASTQIQFSEHFAFNGSVSYVYARRKITDQERQISSSIEKYQPLPRIPPLQSNIGLNYSNSGFKIGAAADLAAKQTRTGDFETPTQGYIVFDFFTQYRFTSGSILHTLSLQAQNIFNQTYYNHLSRIKEIRPEPGRNISLLYRIYF